MAGKRHTDLLGVSERARKREGSHLQAHLIDGAHEEPPYSDEEREFLSACIAYRAAKGVSFLTACDYLAVLLAMGYRR